MEWILGDRDTGEPSPRRYGYAMRDGERVRIRIINADSPNLSAGLLDASRENVRRIRREQRRSAQEKLRPSEPNGEG